MSWESLFIKTFQEILTAANIENCHHRVILSHFSTNTFSFHLHNYYLPCFGLDQCLVHNKDSIIVKWSILQEMWTTFLVNKAWFSPTTQFHINSLEWKTIVILCRFTPTSTLHSLCSQIPKCFAPTLISKSGKNRKSTENTRTAFLRVLPRQRQTHGKEQDGTMELTLPMNQTNSNQLLT